jgi:hypothetical protein
VSASPQPDTVGAKQSPPPGDSDRKEAGCPLEPSWPEMHRLCQLVFEHATDFVRRLPEAPASARRTPGDGESLYRLMLEGPPELGKGAEDLLSRVDAAAALGSSTLRVGSVRSG